MHFFLPDAEDRTFIPHPNQESSDHSLISSYSFSDGQYLGVDQYLSKQALMISEEVSQVSSIKEPQTRGTPLFSAQHLINISQRSKKAQGKSVFHNFQKHLLTLLKRMVQLKRKQLRSVPSGCLAIQLWRTFLVIPSTTKKILYVAFGVEKKENDKNLQTLALNIPQLQEIITKHTLIEIEEAQDALRGAVARQLSQIKHRQIVQLCKMKRFQEFYTYFCYFIDEISKGPPCRRLKKLSKECILESHVGQN